MNCVTPGCLNTFTGRGDRKFCDYCRHERKLERRRKHYYSGSSRQKTGFCAECGVPVPPKFLLCQEHAEQSKRRACHEWWERNKKRGWCLWPGCDKKSRTPMSKYCQEHHAENLKEKSLARSKTHREKKTTKPAQENKPKEPDMPIGFLPARKIDISHIQKTETDPRPLTPARYQKPFVCKTLVLRDGEWVTCGAIITAEGRTAGEAQSKLETQIKWHIQDNH